MTSALRRFLSLPSALPGLCERIVALHRRKPRLRVVQLQRANDHDEHHDGTEHNSSQVKHAPLPVLTIAT